MQSTRGGQWIKKNKKLHSCKNKNENLKSENAMTCMLNNRIHPCIWDRGWISISEHRFWVSSFIKHLVRFIIFSSSLYGPVPGQDICFCWSVSVYYFSWQTTRKKENTDWATSVWDRCALKYKQKSWWIAD